MHHFAVSNQAARIPIAYFNRSFLPGVPLIKLCCASTHTGTLPAKPYNAIPGPKGWPVFGNAIEMRHNVHHMRKYLCEGFKKYGDILHASIAS